jgi:hypothetical protein
VSCLKVVCERRYHGVIVSVFQGLNDGGVFKGYAGVNEVLVAKRKELVLSHGGISKGLCKICMVGQEKKQRASLTRCDRERNLSEKHSHLRDGLQSSYRR